jgi:alcohol dehydrogenase
MAIQIAKWFGAEVATTASGPGTELVRSLGADHVIDYKTANAWEVLRDYDYAFDLIGGQDLDGAFRIVKAGGRVVSVAGVPEPATAREDLDRGPLLAGLFWLASWKVRRQAHAQRVDYRFLLMHPSGPDLEFLSHLVREKSLSVTVDRVFPLDQITDAFAYLEEGHAKGKVIVEMS